MFMFMFMKKFSRVANISNLKMLASHSYVPSWLILTWINISKCSWKENLLMSNQELTLWPSKKTTR